jgi:hypothetical protein
LHRGAVKIYEIYAPVRELYSKTALGG